MDVFDIIHLVGNYNHPGFGDTQGLCLLLADERALSRLAAEAGFADYSTFHRRMRAMTGRAPSGLVALAAGEELGPT